MNKKLIVSKEEIFSSIQDILVGIGLSKDEIKNESKLREDLELDSVEIVDLVMGVKKKFQISIKLTNNKNVSINQLCDQILEALNQ